jgi:hypothetical protein
MQPGSLRLQSEFQFEKSGKTIQMLPNGQLPPLL